MPPETSEIYEFASFRLDVSERTLQNIHTAEPGKLPEKAFQTLVHLVRNRGHLVKKDELLRAVWPDTVVEENNLDKSIHAIRQALGEKAGRPRFVETIRKHGYRFVAEVRAIETVAANNPGIDERSQIAEIRPAASNRKSWFTYGDSRLHLFALLSIVATVIIGGFIYVWRTPATSTPARSLAVLPVAPIDASNRDEIYEIGIADALIHKIGQLKGFVVRPLSATRKYADLEQDPLVAGREQLVDYVLVSNYQVADGKMRVTARLLDVKTGETEETYRSEKDAGNVFSMQDAIADDVGKLLLARFADTLSPHHARRGTNNEDAYRLYLQAMYLYGKRTQAASRKAIESLDQAVQLDPNYALAWAAKAHAHRYAGNLGRDTDTHAEYRRSVEAINKALSLDKEISEAYSALCENKYYYEFDFAGAEAQCRQAIDLDPDSPLAHEIYGRFLYHRGRFDEGISEMKTAVDLEPTSLFNQRNLGIALYYAGRYDEAEAQFKRVIAMDESFSSAYMWLRNTLEMQKKFPEAYEWLLKAQKLLGADDKTLQVYETAYKKSGYQGLLREHARFHEIYNQYYVSGILNAQIGEKDKALEYLERSYQRREWGMNSLLIEPHLASLRDDPRFLDLVRRVGL